MNYHAEHMNFCWSFFVDFLMKKLIVASFGMSMFSSFDCFYQFSDYSYGSLSSFRGVDAPLLLLYIAIKAHFMTTLMICYLWLQSLGVWLWLLTHPRLKSFTFGVYFSNALKMCPTKLKFVILAKLTGTQGFCTLILSIFFWLVTVDKTRQSSNQRNTYFSHFCRVDYSFHNFCIIFRYLPYIEEAYQLPFLTYALEIMPANLNLRKRW